MSTKDAKLLSCYPGLNIYIPFFFKAISAGLTAGLQTWNEPAKNVEEFRARLQFLGNAMRDVAIAKNDHHSAALHRQLVAAIPSLAALTPSEAVKRGSR